MNRIDRLTAIILMLQKRRHTANEIARRFEVSKRTIFRDIQALCEMGVPIVTETGASGGYTLLPDFSLSPLQLTFREVLLLRLALSSVTQLADTPFKQDRESLLAKVHALIPHEHHGNAEQLLESIFFEVPSRRYSTPFIEQLLESTHHKQWLSISYRSERGTSTHTILPRRIYTSSGFWYCLAYSHERMEERTFRVDRLLEITPTSSPTTISSTTTSLPYGHPSHPEVVIKLTARGVLVMESDVHLGDQIQPFSEEGGILRFHCPPSEYPWLTRTIIGLGTDAEVLAPRELRQHIQETALEIAQRHH